MLKDIIVHKLPRTAPTSVFREAFVVTTPDWKYSADIRSVLIKLRDTFLRNEYFELETLVQALRPGEELTVVVEELKPTGTTSTRLAVARLN